MPHNRRSTEFDNRQRSKHCSTAAKSSRRVAKKRLVRESLPIQRRLYREAEEVALKNVLAAGTVFIKDVDRALFQNAMRPVYDKFVLRPQQKALFQAIKGMK